MIYKTVRGIILRPYHSQHLGQEPHLATVKRENGKLYRLYQIMPPIPQRFEWINEGNVRRQKERGDER